MSEVRKPQALILTPLDDAGLRVQETLRNALEKHDIDVWKFETLAQGARLANEVQDAIKRADFVIVDITDQNPDILYQLGVVRTLRKPALLIVGETSNAAIPWTIEGTFVFVYDPANLEELGYGVLSRALSLADHAMRKYA